MYTSVRKKKKKLILKGFAHCLSDFQSIGQKTELNSHRCHLYAKRLQVLDFYLNIRTLMQVDLDLKFNPSLPG